MSSEAEPTSSDEDIAQGGADAADPALATTDDAAPLARGAALREKLLARAAAARGEVGGPRSAPRERDAPSTRFSIDDAGDAVEPLDRALEALDEDFDARAPIASPPVTRGLSPNLVAIVGTLLGIAFVSSAVALAMRLDRRAPPTAGSAAPAPSAEPALSAATAPSAVPKRTRVKLPGPWRIADDNSGKRKISGKCGGKPFLDALTGAGVELKQGYRIMTALKPVRDLDKCGKNDEFVALVDGDKRVRAFEYFTSREDVWQAREGADGLLTASKLDLKVERTSVSGAIQVDGGSFGAAAERAGLEPAIDVALRKAMSGFTTLDDVGRGDVLRVVAQELTVLGEFSRYGGVEALELRPSDPKDKPLRLYFYMGQSERGWYDADGRSPFDGGWARPVKDAPITSHFNPKRVHPILKKPMPHTGTDFGAPTGTPVYATLYGTVRHAGPAGPCGNTVRIEHPGGIESGYCHLSRFAEQLKVGDRVKRLQLIGYVGTTGRSTGPHLHFFVKKNGEFFDAMTLKFGALRPLPQSERELFGQTKSRYDALLDAIPLPPALPSAATPAPAAADETDVADVGLPAPGAGPAGAAPSAAAATRPASNVFLTDKDLLQQQSRSDDGESEE